MSYLGTVVKQKHGEIKTQPDSKAFSLIRKQVMRDEMLVFFGAAVKRGGELRPLQNAHIIMNAFEQVYENGIQSGDLISGIKMHLGV